MTAALVIDLSDEYIAVALGADSYLSTIKSSDFWDSTETAIESLQEFLKLKKISSTQTIVFTLPTKALNYQVVTLPEKIKEREKKVLLGLEIDKTKFTDRFNYKKLDITKREEDGVLLCDYMVLGAKRLVQDKLYAVAKVLNARLVRAVPSFMLFNPASHERLSATAYAGEDRTEVCIWGGGFPLTIAAIPNSGQQMEDINRFVSAYFDKIENLDLTNIRLYGPKMLDAGQAFNLSYPNEILPQPQHAIAAALSKAHGQMDLLIKTKLPKPPIAVTPRNIVFLLSIFSMMGLVAYTLFLNSNNSRYEHELKRTTRKAEHLKQIYARAKTLESKKLESETERDFYLKITKRRVPWHLIFFDLGDLTPRNLWLERFSAAKGTIMMAGKATTPEDVAALSLNLSNSSRYFEDAQVVGMRDFKESTKTYTEFQLAAKLKSPMKKEETVVAKNPATKPGLTVAKSHDLTKVKASKTL